MKLTVYNTSMFDFENIGNEEGGLVFEVEQVYADSRGFKYFAKCETPDISIAYKDAESFDEELNDEILMIYTCYGSLKDEECSNNGVMELRDFGIKCFTEFKR